MTADLTVRPSLVRGDAACSRVRSLALAGWSMTELARRSGWSRQIIGYVGRGRLWIRSDLDDDVATLYLALMDRRLGTASDRVRTTQWALRLGWDQPPEPPAPPAEPPAATPEPTPEERPDALTVLDRQVSRCAECGQWRLPAELMRDPHDCRPLAAAQAHLSQHSTYLMEVAAA